LASKITDGGCHVARFEHADQGGRGQREVEDITDGGKCTPEDLSMQELLLLCDAGVDGPAWNVADVAQPLGSVAGRLKHLKKRL